MERCKWIRLTASYVAAALLCASGLAQPPQPKQVDTIVVELTGYGFSQSTITHSANQHFLFVHNVSGLRSPSLVIKDEKGAVAVKSAPSYGKHWNALIDLGPGTYVLTEANHPNWSCTITLK